MRLTKDQQLRLARLDRALPRRQQEKLKVRRTYVAEDSSERVEGYAGPGGSNVLDIRIVETRPGAHEEPQKTESELRAEIRRLQARKAALLAAKGKKK